MDPHSPLTWMTKHFVQSKTPYDALEGLSQHTEDNFALLPPRDVKAIEDKTIGNGHGNDNKSEVVINVIERHASY